MCEGRHFGAPAWPRSEVCNCRLFWVVDERIRTQLGHEDRLVPDDLRNSSSDRQGLWFRAMLVFEKYQSSSFFVGPLNKKSLFMNFLALGGFVPNLCLNQPSRLKYPSLCVLTQERISKMSIPSRQNVNSHEKHGPWTGPKNNSIFFKVRPEL